MKCAVCKKPLRLNLAPGGINYLTCETCRPPMPEPEPEPDLDWYNEGIALLMALMSGRGIVAKDSAERKVYEEWRSRGKLVSGS